LKNPGARSPSPSRSCSSPCLDDPRRCLSIRRRERGVERLDRRPGNELTRVDAVTRRTRRPPPRSTAPSTNPSSHFRRHQNQARSARRAARGSAARYVAAPSRMTRHVRSPAPSQPRRASGLTSL
jgi:hypothetical protein